MLLRDIKSKDTDNTANKEDVYAEILDNLILQDSTFLIRTINNEASRDRLKGKIAKLISEGRIKGIEYVTADEVTGYMDYIMDGYGILGSLIEDDTISDIKVYSYDHIRVKRKGKREDAGLRFRDAAEYDRFVKMLAIKNEIPLSDLNAIQTFTDKNASDNYILRNNICTGLVNSTGGAYVQIRKIPKSKYSAGYLKEAGMFNDEVAAYLADAARGSSGILFAGKGASGKTTLMNMLIDHIPHDKSALVIQENEELFSRSHPDMMFQHIVTSRGEGRIEYRLEDLARNGLLTDLDYFIIGEIKGNEAAHLMMANFTGHQTWTSVHGKSAGEAMYKLADYIKQATAYSLQDTLMMLGGMETIVFMKDFRVYEIAECRGYKNGSLDIRTVYKYSDTSREWARCTDTPSVKWGGCHADD